MINNREREMLKDCFRNIRWIAKVDKMTDQQVVDILKRLKSQGKAAA